MRAPGLTAAWVCLATSLALLMVAAALPAASSANAPAPTAVSERWRIDAAHSHASFRARLFGLFGLRGEFPQVAGYLQIDRAAQTAAIDARVDAQALSMRDPEQAAWARSESFFDTQRYPQIRFEAHSVPLGVLRGGGEIDGTLTLRGVTRPERFAVVVVGCSLVPAAPCTLALSTSIRRSDYGMTSERALLGDRVDVAMVVHGVLEAQPSAEPSAQAPRRDPTHAARGRWPSDDEPAARS